ncbi:MAG: nascent polypeptide-associated complex protein [Thermoprotei archaeon]|nr:MAG: nascent polypeptide-associated complex protein [Thermoprotei archaeon]
MRRLSPRELQRLMRRMGIKVRELNCEKVVMTLPDRDLIIEEPRVSVIEVQGERIYQIVGREVEVPHEEEVEFTEEDVKLVAEQAGVTLEEARRALEEVGGDLAQAIILLKARKGDADA